ncbi:hypothetical protein Cgig2_028217 [Carnegiea gigantea]|uniref:Uncharacterized protein n=1 Tax=Carnegiea gigantea TaxID=171969 RepID=A0A9Q1GXD3_9CARY|nr:hypothetical protein Cgig2_028217 [Carnegiea gigantea]
MMMMKSSKDDDDEDDDGDIDDEEDNRQGSATSAVLERRARLSNADSHSPEDVGVEDRTYDSPIRVSLIGTDSTSFMPTPRVDARIRNPFLDPNQVTRLNQDVGLQASHAGDTSGAGGVDTAFWNIFGSFMPYNVNLIMSALGSMQQSQSLLHSPLDSTPHPTPQPAVVPTPQCTPEPHAQATSQHSGGCIVPWSEHEMAVREKILIESEGDTYLLYYPFTKYEMLLVYNSVGVKQLKNLFAYTCKLRKKDTHMRRKKDNQGNWVCKKLELRLEEHKKRWQEYRSSQSSTDDSSQSPPLYERDIWVKGNLTSKGRVYGFGAKGVVMEQRSPLSVSSHSSSINSYDAREMAMRLNESVVKAAEEVEEEIRAKEAKFENELTQEKAARQREKEKVKSKISKLWRFFKSQQAGSSIAPADTTPSEDDDEGETDPSDSGDSSHD